MQDEYTPAKFDLSVSVDDSSASLAVWLNYAEVLFDPKTMEVFAERYQRVLEAMVASPEQRVSELEVLSAEERKTLLYDWNRTDAEYPDDVSLSYLFNAQVAANPEATALVYEDETLTYAELNTRANRLAREIRARYQALNNKALAPDTLVALYLDRGVSMVVAILAVLKAGGAYVPLSPEQPQARTVFMLEDTDAGLVLTHEHYCSRLQEWLGESTAQGRLLAVESWEAQSDGSNLPEYSGAGDLAYVIYTSGTTGQPKGVMVEQSGVAAFAINNRYIAVDLVERVASLSPCSFDGFVFDAFFSLLNGACLYLTTTEIIHDPNRLVAYLQTNAIDSLFITTALFNQLVRTECFNELPLRQLLFGGEAADTALIASARERCESLHLVHVYGPTETIVYATAYHFDSVHPGAFIGSALNNKRLYVLDTLGQPVPIGAMGELYVGGAGLARGYLNRPELTAERFVDNPFATSADRTAGYTRLYRTGDLVRWRDDGNLEFLGRNDTQVKIRGFRIELGEIEQVLGAQRGVSQAVVIDREHSDGSYLAAYIVPSEQEDCADIESLRQVLANQLPGYMQPSTYTLLECIPLTTNGKLDRRALPDPEWTNADTYVAPRTLLEEQLCSIWASVLELERVGIHDNFFRIGGDSIRAIRLTAACQNQLNRHLSLSMLFEHQTVGALAAGLGEGDVELIPVCESERVQLSFAQERLLFIAQLEEEGSNAYHIPWLMSLGAATSVPLLNSALQYMLQRHPVLNTVYRCDEEGNYYQIERDSLIELSSLSVADESAVRMHMKALIEESFDLSSDAPMRVQHYHTGQGQYLLIVWHHIAFDGWSGPIFFSELEQVYGALQRGQEPPLAPLSISYRDYAQWQRDYLQGERLESLRSYWQQTLSGTETLELPTDRPRPPQVDYRGRDLHWMLEEPLSEQLRGLAREQNTTLYTVLLSAFYMTLSASSGQRDIVVGSPSDNRHHAQTQSLIGFFVNSLVLRCQLEDNDTVGSLIGRVHQSVLSAKAHQELPFEQVVDALAVPRDSSRHPLFQVMFSVQSFSVEETGKSSLEL
ncbi:amino acid adenylation domain-containing protein, partial [Roseobacter sp. HKCCD8882]|uniref:amino acid adenylation domain-containing protein n=1 Tax=Roseobacter sp. HKCCD8882 TaxID=2690498 RepID=UPI0020A161D7